MEWYQVLFVVHQRSIENQLSPGLLKHYNVTIAHSRRAALQSLAETQIDLVLIHVPSLRFDLTRFCAAVRTRFPDRSLFFLLGKGMRLDQLPHADAHLRQPFTIRQVLRRLARAFPDHSGETIAWRDLVLDTEGYILRWKSKQVPLTPKQATLTLAFLSNPETILSRAHLMQEVWGTDYLGDTRTLDVHIHWLRKSLKQLQAPFILQTIRGQGYQLSKLNRPPENRFVLRTSVRSSVNSK